jgi:hypothetical protein
VLLATYLWTVIGLDIGAGINRFDRSSGEATITRRAFRSLIDVRIPLQQIQAVKLEVRDGLNPRRRLALRVQGRRDMPLTRVGEPMPLAAESAAVAGTPWPDGLCRRKRVTAPGLRGLPDTVPSRQCRGVPGHQQG